MKYVTLCVSIVALAVGCTKPTPPTTTAGQNANATSQPAELAPLIPPTPSDPGTNEVASTAGDKLDAEVVYAAALAKASAEDKRVLVHLGAPW